LFAFICPADLEQYDLRRFAAAEPFFTFPVTAVFSLDPGLALRYAATPALVIPAPDLVERKFFLFRAGIFDGFLAISQKILLLM
jgi:hypothetical protein